MTSVSILECVIKLKRTTTQTHKSQCDKVGSQVLYMDTSWLGTTVKSQGNVTNCQTLMVVCTLIKYCNVMVTRRQSLIFARNSH